MRRPDIINDISNSENPYLLSVGILSGIGCLVLGAVKGDITAFTTGLVATPINGYIAHDQARNSSV